MGFIATMLLASVAANADNVSVGIEHTSNGKRIPARAFIALSVITALFSALAVQLGSGLEGRVPSEYADWIAGILLGFVGIRLSLAEIDHKSALLERQWWLLIISLSRNNLAMGLSGGFLGFPPMLFGAMLGGASGLLLWAGTRLGIRLQIHHSSWMHRTGGAILILIALIQFL